MTSPFRMPKFALDGRGGGNAMPPFLQGRTASTGPFQTRPMITPKASVMPGENRPRMPALNLGQKFQQGLAAKGGLQKKAPMQPPATPQNPSQTLFNFLKQDLEGERNRALADTRSSAAARGVFYGTPLTTSEGDIETQFLRGLGQLQANTLQNEQQNELQRLGLASNLLGSPASFDQLSQMGQISPEVFQQIGALFAPRGGPTAKPNLTPAQMNQQLNPAMRQGQFLRR